ncbi:MAG: hypothetical protein M9962_12405 [Oligoflexia bacterium]|nr:hypothetical protein [Oligoflexia bacterium]
MNYFDQYALVVQILTCFFMTGVISVIQLTHYPSFKQIEKDNFISFHKRHSASLGLIAGPAMIFELISGLWLAMRFGNLFYLNAFAVIVLWVFTFFGSVPAHSKLSHGFNEKAWKQLVCCNWPRTVIWLVRSFIFFLYALENIKW